MRYAVPLLLLAACSNAEEKKARAERLLEGHALYELVKRTYPTYDDYEFQHMLEVRSEDPRRVMDMLALKAGQSVADVGCGSGFYTLKFADAVGPAGQVWAIDIQGLAIQTLQERLQDPALSLYQNIRVFMNPVNDTLIPDNALDAALFSHADFYAYPNLLDENRQMLWACYRSLKPNGTMVVVQDMKIVPGSTNDMVIRNFLDCGFRVSMVFTDPDSGDAYFQFRKPVDGPRPPPAVPPKWAEAPLTPKPG